jgi:cobalt-zinc-cadmium efflux system protein
LNLGYLLVEAVAGLLVGSLALLADAAHNLTDVAGLLLAWGAAALAGRRPSARFTYGLGRGTILAALANAVAILVGVGAVIWEAVDRLAAPPPVPGGVVLAVALVGIAVNTGTALLFRERARHDLNARGAFLHMAADAAVSLGVVLAAGLILATGLDLLDPIVAILVSLIVAWTAFDLLRASLGLSFDAVPRGIDPQEVRDFLASRPGVVEVHDLHIWPLSTTTTALTAHLVMPGGHPGDGFLAALAHVLEERFGIGHVTVQIETGDGAACRLAPDEVI